MLSPSLISTVFSQIESLVYFRNKKNHKTNQSEINQIIKLHTLETERHFVRCLFSSVNCLNESKSPKDIYQAQYFSQELNKLLSKSNFVSLVCYSIENPLPTHKNNRSLSTRLFSQITQISTLNRFQEVVLGLSLTHSNDPQLSAHAKQWVHQKLPELVATHLAVYDVQATSGTSLKYLQSNAESQTTNTSTSKPVQEQPLNTGSLHEISTYLLHFILSHLYEDVEHYGLSDNILLNFIDSLRKEYSRSRLSLVLNTLLYPDIVGYPFVKTCQLELNLNNPNKVIGQLCSPNKTNSTVNNGLTTTTTSSVFTKSSICGCGLSSSSSSNNPYLIADLLEELGYECTKTLESTRSVLSSFDVDELNPIAIAKCLCLFLRTTDGQLNIIKNSNLNDNYDNITFYNNAIFHYDDNDERCDSEDKQSDELTTLSSVSSSWNIDNFFTILYELNPNLQLTIILNELDCSEFMITSRQSFHLFKQFVLNNNNNQFHISADYFYHSWIHSIGQLSLLQYCSIYPDIICLDDWPHRCVDISMLQISFNEDEQINVQLWKNIDYVQALLNLSDKGLYSDVYKLFKQVFFLYPDILTATLLETNIGTLRNVMLGHAFVYFLTTRINSQILLQTAWNGGKSNLLTGTDLQQQRHLFIASCIEYTAQLMMMSDGSLEPSTLPLPTQVSDNHHVSANFSQFIELLISIHDSNTHECTVLPILLGTTECLSIAVTNLLHPINISLLHDNSLNNLSDSMNDKMITTTDHLPIHLLLPPNHAIDLTLVLIVCMANVIHSNNKTTTMNSSQMITGSETTTSVSASLVSIQNSIKSFLSQWFTEHFHDKVTADSFAMGVVDYLRAHYSSHVTANTTFILRNKLALPMELRTPSLSLLTHIIQSAQAALSSTISANNLRFPTTANLSAISGLSTSNKFASNVDTNTGVSRNLANVTTLNNTKLNPGVMQHVTNPLTLQLAARRKAQASGIVGPSMTVDTHMQQALNNNFNISIPMEHPPMELSFVNEPIKIQLSKEAEAEANTFFQKLLEGINPPDEMFKTLYDFATQGTPSQRKLLDGILRMLADEVSRHLQDYPETMLPLFADLYGSVLAASTHLFSMRALSMLWRSVLARLFTLPPETHMDSTLFRAMIHILMKAKNTFVHFSNLPNCLASCPVFKAFPHDLQGYILNSELAVKNYALSQQTTASLSKNLTTTGSNGGGSSNQLIASHYQLADSLTPSTSLNLTMPTSNIVGSGGVAADTSSCIKAPDAPEESISDRVYFLFNNVSKVNAKEKSNELATLLSEDRLIPWFAFYLVSKRIPVEQTFHDLFALVLDHIQERVPNVRPKVMYELIRHIKFILRNMRLDKDDMQARSTLKNFGSFLGLITLARNKPVLHDDLNIKDLIYEAYYKGPIPTQYVVPFVARVVRGATESLVFRPPNPWTMAILKVLRELYDMDNVKDWLRFEIEILYRAFDLNLNDIPSANFLRDLTHSSNLDIELCFVATTTGTITTTTTTTTTIGSMNTPDLTGGSTLFTGHLLRYEDVNIRSIRACLNLDELLTNAAINSRNGGTNSNGITAAFALLQANPRLRGLIEPAVLRAINELTTPVFERCARITVTTVVAIVRKDFALDPDPSRMLYAACQMIRHLAAGMSLITAREALGMSLVTSLKNIILTEVQSATVQEKEAVQQLAYLVVGKSMHVCLAYMQKSVAEKAVKDVEKKLEADIKLRTELGPIRFMEQAVSQLASQQSNMPESLRLTAGGPTATEMSVYEEFGRVIPGFAPSSSGAMVNTPSSSILLPVSLNPLTAAPLSGLFDKISGQIERHLIAISGRLRPANDPMCQSLRCLIDAVHLAKTSRDPNVANNIITVMVRSFLEHYRPSFWRDQPRGLETMEHLKEAHMLTLRHMLSLEQTPFGYAWVTRQVSASYARANSSSTIPCTAVGSSINGANSGSSSVNVSVSGVNVNYPVGGVGGPTSVSFSTKREFTVLNEYDLWSTLEALRNRVTFLNNTNLSASLTDPLGLRLRLACARVRGLLDLGLMEQSPLFNNPSCTIGALYAGCSQAHEFDDPPNLQEKVELIMRNWVEIYQSPKQRDPATIDALLSQLTQIGVLPNINNSTRFLRLATIFVIERALKQLKLEEQQQQPQVPNGVGGGPSFSSNPAINRVAAYVELDAYARLVSILINQLGETPQGEYPNAKVALLNKVLGLIAGTLLQEHEVRRDLFHPMPFERLLVILFVELHVGGGEPRIPISSIKSLGPLTFQQQLPLIFCHLLHCLRPEKATAFVFSWLEMLTHRWFVGCILSAPGPPKLRAAYQAMYAQLLADLLKFLGYFLQNALMPKPIQCLYKATLRLLLVLIHDFPEFVSDYYALFCDVVPSNSIQMRNIILSALPKRGIPSADPLQAPPVDQLASLEDPTGYCMEAGSRLPEPMRCELDAYLTTRAPVKLLSELVTMLRRADDIIPPIPPLQFSYNPQQQARHQQALAAYAVALAANDVGPGSSVKNEDKPIDDHFPPSSTSTQAVNKTSGKSGTTESWENSGNMSSSSAAVSDNNNEISLSSASNTTTSRTTMNIPNSVVSGGSGAALAALLWGVRATQQLATFGLADSMHYNIELMTNLTLYVCITAIRNLREKGMPLNMSTIAHTPQMDIIQSLVLNLDNEGIYTILYLFSEQSKEQVKEQISRVLMERLIVNRPHPWGLLMTSAELLRNPAYRFWEHEFARCNPEIEAYVF
ncbi:ccr4-not transcription complex, putative [Schistosoma mansoni]|uniref:ccr4-not transcription complex, putative n=1 Tax=Schistosoma mansoni TaxID=6183 RepID=UPI00022C8648|nr:ccr4-not transcription complex, putative [Schistosoma mansoni]|eukprot:XP_018646224.1 ccr4-not transcription complex, putative [Schistosoma mansoni]